MSKLNNAAKGASFENRFYGYLHAQASRDLSILRDFRIQSVSSDKAACADFAVMEKTTNEIIAVFECKALSKEQVAKEGRRLLGQLEGIKQASLPRDVYLVTEGDDGMFSFWVYDESEDSPVYVGDDISLDLQSIAAVARRRAAERQYWTCSILSMVYAAICLTLFFVTSLTTFEPSTNSLILLGLCGIFAMAPFLQSLRFKSSYLEFEFPSKPMGMNSK